MFQNIINEVEQESKENINVEGNASTKVSKITKIKLILQSLFTKQNILMYIISFMLSMVSLGNNNLAPFGIAMFASICSNEIPMGIIFTVMLIGTFIGFGVWGAVTFAVTCILFVGMLIVFKPDYEDEEVNEQRKLGRYILIATLIVNLAKNIISGFLVYDAVLSVLLSMTVYIFYKVFSNSIILIKDYKIKEAFSIEEVIGASLMLSIALNALGGLSIFGLEIRNILNILIILVLGWKNGILIGATSGVTIGAVLGIIGAGSPIMIASYALSGMIAGIFSKLGKLGVILGFIIGNTLIAYVANGNSVEIIYFKEILVASLGLLLVPKNVEINISDLFVKDKYLSSGPSYRLEENKDTIEKLNTVSETIKEISNSYKNDNKENKEIFIEELNKNLIGLENNSLYEDIEDTSSEIVEDIFQALTKEDVITSENLIEIFAKHNNYIIVKDEEGQNEDIKKDLRKMVKAINSAYKTTKMNFICNQKINENKKTISHQLSGVSKVINKVAEDISEKTKEEYKEEKEKIKLLLRQKGIELVDINIKKEQTGRYIINTYIEACKKEEKRECTAKYIEQALTRIFDEEIVLQTGKCAMKQEENICKQTYVSKDKFKIQVGLAKATKDGSPVSGDSYIKTKLEDGKYLLAISDGMGSGPEARKSSKIAVKMLERLFTNGFDKDSSLELINSSISLNTEDDMYATLDIAIFDLYSGNVEFIKNGSCPTYIKTKDNINLIKSISLPAGILENIDLVVHDTDIEAGDILVMCSDGIIESDTEYQNKELWLKNILEKLDTKNVQKMADIILQEAIDNGFGKAKDDMTVFVIKIK